MLKFFKHLINNHNKSLLQAATATAKITDVTAVKINDVVFAKSILTDQRIVIDWNNA
jgi:hypothetical protein